MTNRTSTGTPTLQFPVEVIGVDGEGRQFSELARTLKVYRNGVSIRLLNSIAPDKEVIVRNPQTGEEALAFVVGQIHDESNGLVCALGFLDASADPWSVKHPESEAAKVVRLECSACGSVSAVSLSDIELEIFEATRELRRFCRACGSQRTWRESDRQSTEKEAAPPPGYPAGISTVRGQAPRSAPSPLEDRRKNRRTAMKMTACLRFAGREVIVQCEDISKGGFRFTGPNEFPRGIRLEVAVPFTKFTNNVFSMAEISFCIKMPNGQFRHGVTYVRTMRPEDWNP